MITKEDIQDICVLSPLQEGIYFHALKENLHTYFEQTAYRIHQPMNPALVEQSFNELFCRHDVLRTVFNHKKTGRPLQVVLRRRNVDFFYEDIKTLSTAQQEAYLTEYKSKDRNRPFDLTKDVLMRVSLIQLSNSEFEFVLSFHHIIIDGWSLGILFNEFLLTYKNLITNATSSLLPVRQFRSYIEWLEKQDKNQAIKFWNDYLQTYASEAGINVLTNKSAAQQFKQQKFVYDITPGRADFLISLARKFNVTVNIIMQSLWGILVCKYNCVRDTVFGTVVAGRPAEMTGIDQIVGMFINTIPLRIQYDEFTTFSSLVKQVKNEMFDRERFGYHSLAEIQAQSHLKQNLIDHIFSFQNLPVGESIDDRSGKPVISKSDDFTHNNYNFTIRFQQEHNLAIEFIYNSELFDRLMIESIPSHIDCLIDQVRQDEDVVIDHMGIVSRTDQENLLAINNETTVGFPNKTILELFENQAKNRPSAIAVTFGKVELTYKDLDEKSNQLARFLRDRHAVQGDDLVGLLMARTELMIIGILGILKSGAAYVPIDPAYPKERVTYTLQDASIKTVITDVSQSVESIDVSENYAIVSLNDDWHIINAYPVTALESIIKPSHLAYIIYTSGSTGAPKGVMVEHKNVVRLLFNDQFQFDFNEKDVWTLFHSVCFDFSVWEIFGALLHGGRLVIVPQETAKSPNQFVDLLVNEKVTVLNQIPTVFGNMIAEIQGRKQSCDLTLRYVIFGGEALRPATLKWWYSRYPQTKLINMFGITETTVHVTYKDIGREEIEDGSSNIGKPIPTLATYIMNEQLHLLPIGVPGEIVVGGEGVARGYLGRPELTRSKFKVNPYRIHERIYCSGDIGVRLGNGDIKYIGRRDTQAKIRGFRIELGEIEANLIKCPNVEDALVIAKNDKEGSNQLVAYIISNKELTATQLREFLMEKLPVYMIPSHFVCLEKFPLTDNGKVDRRALPNPENLDLLTDAEYVAPQNDIEKKLVDIWQTVLQVQGIGIYHNYFTLGGDSLKAIRLISKINQVLNTSLEVKDIFLHQDIASIQTCLAKVDDFAQLREAFGKAKEEIEKLKQAVLKDPAIAQSLPSEYEDFYPMSDIQKGMIYHGLRDASSGVYHDQKYCQIIDASFNYDLFKRVIGILSKQHPILRTSFNISDLDHLLQIVHNVANFEGDVDYLDISYHNVASQNKYIEEYFKADRNRPFESSKPGLWRFRVFKLTDQDYGILFIYHHAILDGWSVASLLTELSNVYYTVKENAGYEPTLLKASYKDYIIDQQRIRQSAPLRNYWKKVLEGYERTSLPLNKTAAGDTFTGLSKFYSVPIDENLNADILSLHDETKISIKNICLAAFAYLMQVTTNSTEITIGLVTNGRPNIEDGDKILGCFLNSIPFRIQEIQNFTLREFLQYINKFSNELKSYDKLSLFEILKEIGKDPDKENPVFDILFNFTDFHVYNNVHAHTTIYQSDVKDYERTNTPFDFHVKGLGSKIEFSICYLPTLYSEAEIARISKYYINILKQLCYNKENKLQMQFVLEADETHKLLYSLNNTKRLFPTDHSIVDLIEMQVKESPEAIAIICGENSYSFRAINEKANQLAHFLNHRIGIKPSEFVGLMTDRSVHMIIGMLGILKVGAAYVPIDPDYPKERISYMLEDSQLSVLVTTSSYRDVCEDLQWEIESFKSFICLDGYDKEDDYAVAEEASKQLWNFVAKDAANDFVASGWVDSYAKEVFPEQDMNEFISNVLIKLKPYLKPEMKVLEVGCGSGMIMFEVAPYVKQYVGTDISDEVLKRCQMKALEKGVANIELHHLTAAAIDTLQTKFDIIIVNSVIQYFPSHHYLREFLNKAVSSLTNEGFLFLGDIRDKSLQWDYYRSLYQGASNSEIEKEVLRKRKTENELFLNKNFFQDYFLQSPYHTSVQFSDKVGEVKNELLLFRYDALIQVSKTRENDAAKKPLSKYQILFPALDELPAENLDVKIDKTAVAYLIYTSGSTGVPKGIEIMHFNTVQFIYWARTEFNTADFDIVYATTSYCFDLSIFEIFYTLTAGKKLRILNSGVEIPIYIEEDKNILINTVPSLISALLKEQIDFKNVTVLNMAGEPIPYAVKEALDYNTIQVRNLYGPSEDTTYSSCYRFNDDQIIPIGKPIANTAFYIVDNDLNLLPEGVIGELCIAGDGVAKGYYRRPELTSEKFITNNPFDPEKKLYRTGDLARWLADGNVEFVGRKDNQVKVKGYRIELGEIDNVLGKHHTVEQSLTIIRDDEMGNKQIVTYLTLKSITNEEELRLFMEEKLPDYMVPSYFVILKEFPLNSNGKVDRRALPDPFSVATEGKSELVQPTTIVEEKLLEIWRKVLGREHLGIRDNFYSSGGDSIKAIQVVSRMYKLGYKLEVKDIFKNPTIEELARVVKSTQHVVDQSAVEGNVVLTPIQNAFFLKPRLNLNHFNQSVTFYSRNGFDLEILKKVFLKIQHHHDILRMNYHIANNEVYAVNKGLDSPSSIVCFDFKNKINPVESMQMEADRLQRSLDLENGPLMKIGLFQLPDGDRLFIVIHHLVIDGVSWRILFEDIQSLYQQFLKGETPVMALKTDSFKTWAQHLGEYANSNSFLKEKSYWHKLENEVIPSLPVDFLTNENTVKDANKICFHLSATETDLLITEVNKAYNTEINDILLAGLGLAVKKVFQMNRLLIALEGHGRVGIVKNVDVSRTVGWFTTVFPVLLDTNNDYSLAAHIISTKEHLHQIPHKGIGYGILRYLTKKELKRDMEFRLEPLVSFNYLGQFDDDIKQASFVIAEEDMGCNQNGDEKREYLIDITGIITGKQLEITISYGQHQYAVETIQQLSTEYQNILQQIIKHCISKENTELTPSDFDYKELTMEDLNSIFK